MPTTLENLVAAGAKLTPMMEQYHSIKKGHPEQVVLFRMGDFYEAFFEDATQVSQSLNIALTHRGKIGQLPIPMAGIPHHAAATYIDRLTGSGIRVAICEQVEDAAQAKGIVKRAVTQVVGPGIPYDLDKVEAREERYLAAGCYSEKTFYLASVDFTTGEFIGQKFADPKYFLDQLDLCPPRELVTFMGQWEDCPQVDSICQSRGITKAHLSSEYFETQHTEPYLEKWLPGYRRDQTLATDSAVLSPIGALAYYICSTQQLEQCTHLRPFRLVNNQGHLKVALPTLMGLEILPRDRASYKHSLLGFLDRTQTAMGGRLLRRLVAEPLKSRRSILERQEVIHFFLQNDQLTEGMRREFKKVGDIARILAKVSTRKASAGDLLNLSRTIAIYTKYEGELQGLKGGAGLQALDAGACKKLRTLGHKIEAAVSDEMGASWDKGNVIRCGFHPERDRLAELNFNAHDQVKRLEDRYRRESGIPKLRVKSNNIAGYFIEISRNHAAKVPAQFVLKQTLVNGQRFVTEELERFEKEVLSASEKLRQWERHAFVQLLEEVEGLARSWHSLAETLAWLDCFLSLAWVSRRENFTRPVIKEKKGLRLRGMWHPLVKGQSSEEFVAHDLILDGKNSFGLITGPNMAGKTTVMREMAIVQILAQMGCFVPAESAEVSVCDYLFSRLGASDDILRGHSTFMVEMAETAEIVRHATSRSMVILDEVGRGTSTYDGLAIAWALVEHLVSQVRPLGLFATHYHELIEVVEELPGAKNLTMETRSLEDRVLFLYRLVEGAANQSYGIYVAKLAGLPRSLIRRARGILAQLESGAADPVGPPSEKDGQLCMNLSAPKASKETPIPPHLLELEGALQALDLSRTTPLEALNQLHALKEFIPK